MSRTKTLLGLACLTVVAGRTVSADDVRYFERDGITYRETRQVVRRPVVETRYEPREYTVYQPKYVTETKQMQRNYQVAVTEYQWQPVWQRSWNPFVPPYLAYQYVPIVRWEPRSDTVQVPTARWDWVPEKRTQQVPVVSQRLAEDEVVTRVAVGTRPPAAPGATQGAVAGSQGSGGVKLDGDPPREATGLRSGDSELRR